MKLGTIFYEKDYSTAYKFIVENGYTIKELEKDDNGRRFQIVEIPQPTEQQLAENEIFEIKEWFANTYTYQEQKYIRLIYLDKTDDDGVDAETKLMSLYSLAEEKRKRTDQRSRFSERNAGTGSG